MRKRTTYIRAALLALLFIAAAAHKAAAQGAGRWTLYPSYADITEIEPAGKNVFVLASENVYSYNTDEASITTYDKTQALSDTGVGHIAWCAQARRLVITYGNSNIDLLADDGTRSTCPTYTCTTPPKTKP